MISRPRSPRLLLAYPALCGDDHPEPRTNLRCFIPTDVLGRDRSFGLQMLALNRFCVAGLNGKFRVQPVTGD